MQARVDDPPIVRCPGCNQPMEPKERTSVKPRLVDIRYVCVPAAAWKRSAPLQTKRTELVRMYRSAREHGGRSGKEAHRRMAG
jgi:hypothetical protein